MSSSNKTLSAVYDRSCHRPIPKSTNKTPSIKPSVLGSPCVRKVYYSYNKAPEDIPFPLANARITNLGNAVGKILFDAFDKEGIAIRFTKPDGTYYIDDFTGEPDYEFRLTCPELAIKLAKIDIVVTLDDGLWLGEFKSINERGFKELKGPKNDHMIQGVTYLYLFNRALKEGLFSHIPQLARFEKANGIRYLYYWKDKSELKEFVIPLGPKSEQIFRNVVEKVQQVQAFTEANELPPPSDDYCKTCTYQFRCAQSKKAHE